MDKENIKIILTEDGSQTLYRKDINETYHSFHGAIQESLHVFIKHGLEFYATANPGEQVSILEIGFGTGLNALLSLQFAEEKKIDVTFHSLEPYPVPKEIISQLKYALLLGNADMQNYFDAMHQCDWDQEMPVSRHFNLNKIAQSLQFFKPSTLYNIIYFDAFAPSKQEEMWHIEWLEKVVNTMKAYGVFVTYCAKGQLKRDLKSLGLEVETLPGPPGKKEMVRAIKQ